MEDKIEVEDDVRINNDFRLIALGIGKVVGINKDSINVKMNFELPFSFKKENIANHSKQLIDLIEVKDVIKYRINNISTTLETKGYVEGIVDISDEEMLQRIKNDKNYEVLEILTKESYMANCYKVGGEDE